MSLSPSELKNLLHHILSGKEFGVQRHGQLLSCYKMYIARFGNELVFKMNVLVLAYDQRYFSIRDCLGVFEHLGSFLCPYACSFSFILSEL